MKKHEKCRILAEVISGHLYSESLPVEKLNDIFLRWVDERKIPTDAEVEWLKKQLVGEI